MKLITKSVLCCVGLFAGIAQSALAAPVFTGDFVGAFDNAISASGSVSSISNNDAGTGYSTTSAAKFLWGTRYSSGSSTSSTYSNSFVFDGTGSDLYDTNYSVGLDTAFSLGQFTYKNMPTYNSNVTGVDFKLAATLTGVGSQVFTFGLGIINTPNDSADPRDYVQVNSLSASSVDFTYTDGNSYTFELLGFSTDNGLTFSNSTYAEESSSTVAQIYGRFVAAPPAPVPVPAAAWLLLSGLAGLGFAARRKQ